MAPIPLRKQRAAVRPRESPAQQTHARSALPTHGSVTAAFRERNEVAGAKSGPKGTRGHSLSPSGALEGNLQTAVKPNSPGGAAETACGRSCVPQRVLWDQVA